MFRFRFEAVLTHRQFIQETRQKALAEEKRLLEKAQAALRNLRNAEKIAAIRFQQQRAAGMTIAENRLYVDYLEQVRQDIRRQQQTVSLQERSVIHKRNLLLEAVKQCQIMEKLKEKQAIADEQEAQRQENNLLHEISLNRKTRILL